MGKSWFIVVFLLVGFDTYCCCLIILPVPKWDVDEDWIQFRPSKKSNERVALKPFQPMRHDGTLHNNIMCQSVTMQSIGILNIFQERGLYSLQPYQPHANHRQLNFANFHHEHFNEEKKEKVPSMIDSLMDASVKKYGFSNGDLISYFFYSLRCGVAEDKSQLLKTGCSIQICGASSWSTEACKTGVIDGVYADVMTGGDFLRLLRFFGYQWKKKKENHWVLATKDDDVELFEIAAFISQLSNHSLESWKSFDKFLDAFSFAGLFDLDESLSLEWNRRNFYALVQAYVPVRKAVFDGKHRDHLCGFFDIGNYDPQPMISSNINNCPWWKKKTMSDFGAFGGKDRAGVFTSDMQTYTIQTINIGMPQDAVTFAEKCHVLRDFGRVKTSAAGVTVNETFESALSELCDFVIENRCLENISKLDHGNYWTEEEKCSGIIQNNNNIIEEAILDFIKERKKEDLLFVGNSRNTSIAKVKKELKSAMEGYEWPATNKQATRNFLPNHLCWMVVFAKLLFHDEVNVVALKRFLQHSNPEVKNAPLDPEYFQEFFKAHWYRNTLIPNVSLAAKWIVSKMLVEKKLLTVLRVSKNVAEIAQDLSDGKWPNFPSLQARKEPLISFHQPAWGQQLRDKALNTSKMTCATKRMHFAVHSRVLHDVLSTVVKYGVNPLWVKSPVKQGNANLELYLR